MPVDGESNYVPVAFPIKTCVCVCVCVLSWETKEGKDGQIWTKAIELTASELSKFQDLLSRTFLGNKPGKWKQRENIVMKKARGIRRDATALVCHRQREARRRRNRSFIIFTFLSVSLSQRASLTVTMKLP